MRLSIDQLDELIADIEGEILEFKEAKNNYEFDNLGKYCSALANEGGGKIVLGVTDKRPRKVVGTKAFEQIERTRKGLLERIPLLIEVCEVRHPNGRVLVFRVPGRPLGTPIAFDGRYWSRNGDSLVSLSADRLRGILLEAGRDFSAEVCPGAAMADLSSSAIEEFRRRWIEKSGNKTLKGLTAEQLLRDADALADGGVTYAALVLFGRPEALNRYLAQSEVVFEYRSSETSGPAQERKDFRRGFFDFYEDLWKTVNLRNDKQHYEDGMFILDIPTFDERSIREAILNAVSHRDYQLGGSTFIRQYPRRLEIVSPGAFPLGVDENNVLDKQSPRNRRIAEILMKCGLVERSGQGMNLIFEHSIEQGKSRPDFTGTDAHQVRLTLLGTVQDPNFVRFLEKIGQETGRQFSTQDLLVFDCIHREVAVPGDLLPRRTALIDEGLVEQVGRGKGARFLLSRRFYVMTGRKGVYTRKKGLDRETNKELLMQHLRENAAEGSRLLDLAQVLPGLSRPQVQTLLRELRIEGKAVPKGTTRAARWYPAGKPG